MASAATMACASTTSATAARMLPLPCSSPRKPPSGRCSWCCRARPPPRARCRSGIICRVAGLEDDGPLAAFDQPLPSETLERDEGRGALGPELHPLRPRHPLHRVAHLVFGDGEAAAAA